MAYFYPTPPKTPQQARADAHAFMGVPGWMLFAPFWPPFQVEQPKEEA